MSSTPIAPIEEPLQPLADRFLAETSRYWQRWVKACDIPAAYQAQVIRKYRRAAENRRSRWVVMTVETRSRKVPTMTTIPRIPIATWTIRTGKVKQASPGAAPLSRRRSTPWASGPARGCSPSPRASR